MKSKNCDAHCRRIKAIADTVEKRIQYLSQLAMTHVTMQTMTSSDKPDG